MRPTPSARPVARPDVPSALRIAARSCARAAALALVASALVGCEDLEEPDEPFDPDSLAASPFAPAPADPFAGPTRADAFPGDGGLVDPDAPDLPADDDPADRPFAPADVAGDYRNLAGLYDASVRRPLGTDVRYVQITAGGAFVVFDYQGDAYGRGGNCFLRGRPGVLVRDRGDDYFLDGRSVRIARETLGIGFGYTDGLDEDRDGDPTDLVYYRYPEVVGLSPLDLVPCR